MKFKDRNTLFPIAKQSLFDLYETQLKAVWTPYEIDFTKDLKDLNNFSKEERHLILQVLAFFAQSDSIVNENLAIRFMKDVNIPEALQFYSFQIGIEAIHAHTYAKMIDTYISDSEEKEKLFNAIKNYPMIAKKAAWMKKWIDSQESFAKRLLAFAIVEGIFFSGSFCTIYWLKDKGKMPALSMANDQISRDEGIHWVFAATLYKELVKMDGQIKSKNFFVNSRLGDETVSDQKLGELLREVHYTKKSMLNEEFKVLKADDVKAIIQEAVAIEKEFITESVPTQLLGINSKLMAQYIEYIADLVVNEFGFDKIYNAKQPFDFMIKNDVRGKVNFFEHTPTEYLKAVREEVSFDKISEDF
jgi:ribonucleoside-diphosphate reductase beta chain